MTAEQPRTWNQPVVATEPSRVEDVDVVDQDWLYSGPGVVPPDPRLKVWRQNRATGAIEELVLPEGKVDDRTGHFYVAREVIGGGGDRLVSKDFPHSPTKEQERALAEAHTYGAPVSGLAPPPGGPPPEPQPA
jgi:hypothetical protein